MYESIQRRRRAERWQRSSRCPECGTAPSRYIQRGTWTRSGDDLIVHLAQGTGAAHQIEPELQAETLPTVRYGSRGSAVQQLQAKLKTAGFDPGPIDGIFGSGTRSAVRQYQSRQGLSVDGVVGPATWSALNGARPQRAPTVVSQPNWVLPPDVKATGEAQYVRRDPEPAWDNGANCTRFTPGTDALKQYIQGKFAGVRSIGGYSCRQNSASPNLTSVHGIGRALDIMIPMVNGNADSTHGDPIANWLVTNAEAIGVQYIIWNRTQWSGHRSGRKDRPYTGPSPHTDHIHVELNLDGAARRTPWFAQF